MRREDILDFALRPQQYLGNELNSIHKKYNKNMLRIALCFPDTYTIGMSNYALKILYYDLNKHSNIIAERVFVPENDVADFLIDNNKPLFSLESFTSVNDFDILAFTLSSELLYTNLLHILKLSQIPFTASERDKKYPLILAGGISTFNPEPVSSFIDAFYLGDSEALLSEMLIKNKKNIIDHNKNGLLQNLNIYENIYIPELNYNPYYKNRNKNYYGEIVKASTDTTRESFNKIIKKNVFYEMSDQHIPLNPVIPYFQVVQDRAQVEIARGCTRGCRFCSAGYLYQPYRERPVKDIITNSVKILDNTGYDNFNMSSLSVTDHSDISELLPEIRKKLDSKCVSLSVPSLRINSLSKENFNDLMAFKKAGLTFAVEAGSQKGRDIINKNISEEEIYQNIKTISDFGWQLVKLYFMIGLPFIKNEEEDICHLVEQIIKINPRLKININIGTFVPKAHTPFQWHKILHYQTARDKIEIIKIRLKPYRNIRIKFQDPKMSYIESFLSTGDKSVSKQILKAYNSGCFFDAWDDRVNYEQWLKIINESRFDEYINKSENHDLDEELPWDMFYQNKELLKKEYKKAKAISEKQYAIPELIKQEDYRITYTRFDKSDHINNITGKMETKWFVYLYFDKIEMSRYIAHLDVMKYIEKILRMYNFPLAFSKGFSPHVIMSVPFPIPLGFSSFNDLCAVQAIKDFDITDLIDFFNKKSQNGLTLIRLDTYREKRKIIPKQIKYTIKGIVDKSIIQSIDQFKFDFSNHTIQDEIKINLNNKTKTLKIYNELNNIEYKNDLLIINTKYEMNIRVLLSYLNIPDKHNISRELIF